MADLAIFETEINTLVKEYLSYIGLDTTVQAFQLECNEKGKSIPIHNEVLQDAAKLTAQNNLLLEFDSGESLNFWRLWEENVPFEIRSKDQTCQRLEFYIQIHFAVYPIRTGSATVTNGRLQNTMTLFKQYLETKGSDLSQTTEFLPFYALPFVPNPMQHPSFKELFSTYWIPELRGRVDKFLSAALSSSEPPALIALVVSLIESTSEKTAKSLQQNLLQAEKRSGAYMKRFNKLQADYHTLISITAELVDSLEQTVHGRMVTVEYLQKVCARLFSGRSAAVGSSFNTTSVDFTRPGTASSILRASIIPERIDKSESTLLPSLDYSKIKYHLQTGPDRTKAFLLQALRWRLTRSSPGEQRDTVLLAYIDNDLFNCNPQNSSSSFGNFNMLSLFDSSNAAVRQYVARLYNALSSLQQGRAYLCLDPEAVGRLQEYLWKGNHQHNTIDPIFEEHLLGCLQKLSLRRLLQTVMIKGDLIRWLVSTLADRNIGLSDYMLEYAVALLMNLCLRKSGKQKCGENATQVLKVLSDLLSHENMDIRPYINGALYSVLNNPVVKKEAHVMGLEEILREFMEGEQEEFRRQLEFIIKQLNSDDEGSGGGGGGVDGEDSDDDGNEDDDEDQDAMEADLDKDEIIQPLPSELSGEEFLCSEYLGIMTNIGMSNKMESLIAESGIPQRPVTPGHQRNSLQVDQD
uniref:LisH domain-containing protein ARMC9 n=1 Tax=Ciona intestinalis TaxID=7719 RepID=F7B890_CIOIN